MKNEKIVIKCYVKFKAEKVHGKFLKSTKVVLRERITMTEAEAEEMNLGYESSGIYVELDKDATKKFSA